MNEKNNTLNGIHNRIQTAAAMVVQEKNTLTCTRMREILLKAMEIQDTELSVFGLEIREHGYGLYQLYRNGAYVIEDSHTYCQSIATGIIDWEGKQLLNEE